MITLRLSKPRSTCRSSFRLASSSPATTSSGVATQLTADEHAPQAANRDAAGRGSARRSQRLVRPARQSRAAPGRGRTSARSSTVRPTSSHSDRRRRARSPACAESSWRRHARSRSIPAHASTTPTRHRAHGKHAALRQQIAHDATARGAERRAHRQLPAPARHARDQQIRRVRARDQPDERDGGERQAGDRRDVADDVRLQIHHAPRRLVVLIRGLPDREDPPVDGAQLAGRRRRGRRRVAAGRSPCRRKGRGAAAGSTAATTNNSWSARAGRPVGGSTPATV